MCTNFINLFLYYNLLTLVYSCESYPNIATVQAYGDAQLIDTCCHTCKLNLMPQLLSIPQSIARTCHIFSVRSRKLRTLRLSVLLTVPFIYLFIDAVDGSECAAWNGRKVSV